MKMDAAIHVLGWLRLVLLVLAAGFAVKALNVLMHSKRKKRYWRKSQDSEVSNLLMTLL